MALSNQLSSRTLAWSVISAYACTMIACSPPTTEEYVRVLEHLGNISERHRDNCGQMGRALVVYLEKHGKVIRDYQDHTRRLPRPDKERIRHYPLKSRVRRAMRRLIPGHKKCAEDADVKRAYQQVWQGTDYETKPITHTNQTP